MWLQIKKRHNLVYEQLTAELTIHLIDSITPYAHFVSLL